MELMEIINKRDTLKQEVAILNLKQLLGYLSVDECNSLSTQKNILKELELQIIKLDKNT